MEGVVIQDNYDSIAVTGAGFTATSLTATTQVSDGKLISYEPAMVNNPKVNALEVWKV
jgi:hypothetical protein